MLATDYDGTLARHGTVEPATLRALARWREAGRRVILVTGRELHELREVFPQLDSLDLVVAENGALLYEPVTQKVELLCPPTSREFVEELGKRGVAPLFVGRAIVATQEPNQGAVAEVIAALKLPLEIIMNKGSVMVLPGGVNKATGLQTALRTRGWNRVQTAAIGDGENDYDLLAAGGLAVAVSNAVPELKKRADYVTQASHGAGVAELLDLILAEKLEVGVQAEWTPPLT